MFTVEHGGALREWLLTPMHPRRNSRTKAQVLEARVKELRNALAVAEHTLEGLKNTPCNIVCSGCGQKLATEYDFAAHFVVTDERHLNLGNCPEDVR